MVQSIHRLRPSLAWLHCPCVSEPLEVLSSLRKPFLSGTTNPSTNPKSIGKFRRITFECQESIRRARWGCDFLDLRQARPLVLALAFHRDTLLERQGLRG